MCVDRSELRTLVDKIPEADLPVTRKLLRAIDAAEVYFDNGGEGIPHKDVLKEFA